MAELLPDTWPNENTSPEQGHPYHRTCCPPVTEIIQWLECFGRLASMLRMKHPNKVGEFSAYQLSILRAARNFKGTAWVAYELQYRRKALARRDLNWSVCNAQL